MELTTIVSMQAADRIHGNWARELRVRLDEIKGKSTKVDSHGRRGYPHPSTGSGTFELPVQSLACQIMRPSYRAVRAPGVGADQSDTRAASYLSSAEKLE